MPVPLAARASRASGAKRKFLPIAEFQAVVSREIEGLLRHAVPFEVRFSISRR
jgi:hypothetical protein